ncbi:hypothetical protein QBC44DRAFT_370457 [Cladorrhinum sp. PSN332]|nr:hypothetical protein QBC44DRAFT_370457 [Cladorrhinum sp. PSN332]
MFYSSFSMVISTLLGLATVAVANPINPSGSLASDYTITQSPLEWDIPLSVDGPTVKQWGTVQQVRANMTAYYPGWDKTFPVRSFTDSLPEEDITVSRYTQESYKCDNLGGCDRDRIVDGVNYLMSVPGKPRMDAGPGKCIRVSCSWDAAIFMCNDNDHEYYLNAFTDVSSAAYFLYNQCRSGDIYGHMSSQVWYKEHWNTMIKWDKC